MKGQGATERFLVKGDLDAIRMDCLVQAETEFARMMAADFAHHDRIVSAAMAESARFLASIKDAR